tara:strand:+ start:1193 stop:1525 length:333 start_codon:yes stop_codon:yes gene_type:complete
MNKNIISISNIALKKIKDILKETNKKNILFAVNGGGCNGFEYQLKPSNVNLIKGNELYIQDNVNIHICSKSLIYILGTHIDWKQDIMEQRFVFSNPLAKSKCGCGTSFNI